MSLNLSEGSCTSDHNCSAGHISDKNHLDAWMSQAHCWIEANGKKWLTQTLEEQRKITMYQHVSLFNIREEKRINVGIADTFGKLYNQQ